MEIRRFWDGEVPWVTPKDMKQESISESGIRVTNAAVQETSLRLIPPPAVLLVVRGMILARRVPVAWTIGPVTINQDMKALVPMPGISAEFLTHVLNSAQDALQPLIDEAGHGTRRLPSERWRNLVVAIPSQTEQRSILNAVRVSTHTIATATHHTQREIDLLREYRTRLIGDVVTGKFDVRRAAAQLQDEVEQPMSLAGSVVQTHFGYESDDEVNAAAWATEV